MAKYLHTMLRITDPAKSKTFYEALGMEFRRESPIVRNGELEATLYFFGYPGQDEELELTLNHDGRTYELGTAYGHIAAAVDDLEADDGIGCILLAGGEKAFAAGADIKEMQPKTFIDMFSSDFNAIGGNRVANCRKPTIAAVSGYALGGGCELAMMCDIIVAADTAKFGQPEITLGTIPGIGGTQRLTRAVGKSKAMDLCLTGRMMDAAEAERSGLVSRVVPSDQLMDEALAVAEKIASMSRPAAAMGSWAPTRRLPWQPAAIRPSATAAPGRRGPCSTAAAIISSTQTTKSSASA